MISFENDNIDRTFVNNLLLIGWLMIDFGDSLRLFLMSSGDVIDFERFLSMLGDFLKNCFF